jgi:hypothetical protein
MNPLSRRSLADIGRGFLYTDVVVETRAPELLEELPELPDRVRGAWGRRLEDIAARQNAQTWLNEEPSAWSVFFGPPILTSGLDPVRPYVIRTDRSGKHVTVTLRLFGFADCWLEDSFSALVAALEGGIAIRERSSHRVPFAVVDHQVQRHWGIAPTSRTARTYIALMTPLALRAGQRTQGSLARLGGALSRRLRALARWQDADLIDPEEWRRIAQPDWTEADSDLSFATWIRFSSSQQSGQPIRGFVGRSILSGLDEDGWMLLNLGQVMHAGSGCAAGLGRIEVY